MNGKFEIMESKKDRFKNKHANMQLVHTLNERPVVRKVDSAFRRIVIFLVAPERHKKQ